jgi:hypothetical protein
MKYILKYRANTFLPPDVADILETAKTDLLTLSREPDKAVVFFDAMCKDLINWFSYHAEPCLDDDLGELLGGDL